MQASQIDLLPFGADHLDGALSLSQQAGWPHRREDWAFVLSVSKGFVAVENGKVVATAMATLYGETCATINMVIVFAECSGRFLRVDTLAATGLAPWLSEHGLVHVGGGLPMRRALPGMAEAQPAPVSTFALTSQALG